MQRIPFVSVRRFILTVLLASIGILAVVTDQASAQAYRRPYRPAPQASFATSYQRTYPFYGAYAPFPVRTTGYYPAYNTLNRGYYPSNYAWPSYSYWPNYAYGPSYSYGTYSPYAWDPYSYYANPYAAGYYVNSLYAAGYNPSAYGVPYPVGY